MRAAGGVVVPAAVWPSWVGLLAGWRTQCSACTASRHGQRRCQCCRQHCRAAGRLQVWLRAVRYRLATGDAEQARKTLDRSLQSLPPFEHIRMISQAALLEFKLGDAGG